MYTPSFPPKGIHQFELPHTKILLDLDHFPYFIFRAYGAFDRDSMRLCYMLRDPYCLWASMHDTKVWILWDIGHLDPKRVARQEVAYLTQQADRIDGYLNVTMVVKSRLMRGAATAVKWLTGELVTMDFAKDFPLAVRNAQRSYQAHGLRPPNIPADYALADWDDARHTLRMGLDDIWWSLERRGDEHVPGWAP